MAASPAFHAVRCFELIVCFVSVAALGELQLSDSENLNRIILDIGLFITP